MRYVVDTNVPIVANGGSQRRDSGSKPSLQCRSAAVDFLQRLLKRGRIVLDLGGEIQKEYLGHLSPRGQPGVGDRFLQVVLNSVPKRVTRIELAKVGEAFIDFPDDPRLSVFDLSDRKFVAASLKANAPIAVAVDDDWLDHSNALSDNGVRLRFICGRNKVTWFERTPQSV